VVGSACSSAIMADTVRDMAQATCRASACSSASMADTVRDMAQAMCRAFTYVGECPNNACRGRAQT